MIIENLKRHRNEKTTKAQYHKIWTSFNKFLIRLSRLPKTWEERTSLFCGYLIFEKERKSQTVKSYVSAIKSVLWDDGYEWKGDQLLFNSLTRACKLENDTVKTRLPIGRSLLELILFEVKRKFTPYRGKSQQPYLALLYQTIFLTSYYGLLRVGEVAESPHTIKAVDVHVADDKSKFLLILHTSKTHGKGNRPQKIRIQGIKHVQVELEDKICTFSEKLDTSRHSNKKFFCPVDMLNKYVNKKGDPLTSDEALFTFADHSTVKPHQIRSVLRYCLGKLNLDASLYDTHSFRIGRASDLLKNNCSIDKIKQLGRWKSNAAFNYLRH